MASLDPTLLLQELLSPPSEDFSRTETLQLVAYFLSTLPLDGPHLHLITLICRYSLTSRSLWPPSGDSTPDEGGSDAWQTSTAVYSTFHQATLLRLDHVSREVGTGFRARRIVSKFIAALDEGLWLDQVRQRGEAEWGNVEPVHRLLVTSAILSALQEWKRRKERLWVGGRGMLDRIETGVGKAWHEWVAHGDRKDSLPAWIAAQTVPSLSAEVLARDFPASSILSYLVEECSTVFDDGNLFDSPSLAEDLDQSPEGLAWRNPSPSHSHLTQVTRAPLFGLLGPLSRSLGRLLSANASVATSYDPLVADSAVAVIKDLSHTLFTVTTRLSSGWAATPWSDLVEDSALSPSTRSQTQPWTVLKSLLFAQTLVYSSLLEVVSSDLSEVDAEPTSAQRELAREAVVALGKTYFVASRFGQGGFKAWRAVLAGMVDVAAAPSPSVARLGLDRLSPAEQLAREMETPLGDDRDGTHSRLVVRAASTFWMNTIEQVMDELSDSYVESSVLPRCKPYLDCSKYPEPFESAHSVLLAIFSSGKACVPELASWYTELLLNLPSLTPTQLRLAYSTVVSSTSKFDDALAWWCIQELLSAIERLPVADAASLPGSTLTTSSRPRLRDLGDDSVPESQGVPDVGAQPDQAAVPTLETRILALPRGALLLTLVALLPSVNFVLFRSLLSRIARLAEVEPADHDGRHALGQWTFEVLGTAMDVVKREEGVRWWMEHGRALLGGPGSEGRPHPEVDAVEGDELARGTEEALSGAKAAL
ncbi:hypothetical protein JCM11491_007105 [Sporobolomyces phaffii]